MQNKIFSRYNREMKEALKKGDEIRLLALASRSALLIAMTRHDLGQFYKLSSRGGLGNYKKAVARLEPLSTSREREFALFTLIFFAGRQGDAAAMKELLPYLTSLFPEKVDVYTYEGPVPEAAWEAVLTTALGMGIDPDVIIAGAANLGVAGPLLAHCAAGGRAIDMAAWERVVAVAAKAGIGHIYFRRAAIQFAVAECPGPARATVAGINGKYERIEAGKELVAALTSAGLEREAFEAFLETGKDGELYQDELTMPILQNLMNKGHWPEAIGIVPKLPNETSRQDVLKMIITRLAGERNTKDDTWELLAVTIDSLHIYGDTAVRGKLIKGLARHGLYEAALAQVNKLDSDKLRQDGMMLLMEQMREAGEAPKKIREMLKDFNAPDGMWNQPPQPPIPSIMAMLGEYLHESGFVDRLRQVSEIFGNFCGRPPAYKRLLGMGLIDEAFGEALEMSRADRKMAALSEIAQLLHDQGRAEDAETVLQYGLKQCGELEHRGEKARCLAELALGLARTDKDAQTVFSEALALVQMIPEEDHRIWPLERIVVCEARAGHNERARVHLELLLGIFASPGIEEKEEQMSDLIRELVEANAVDIATHALRHLLKAAAADPDGNYLFKLFCKLRRIKILPGWTLLALISLSSEFAEKAASAILGDVNDLAIEKNHWELAIAACMKQVIYETDSSCFFFLRKALLEADIPASELDRLMAAHPEVFFDFPDDGREWLWHLAMLMKAGRREQAEALLKEQLGKKMNKLPSPCEQELREMKEMAASGADSPTSAVPWALSFRPTAFVPETAAEYGSAVEHEQWNRLFSSIIEEKGVEERLKKLDAFFWSVPVSFAATFANILAYHPLLLRLPAMFALVRRSIAEKDRTLGRLAVPLSYDCLDAVEICRLALKIKYVEI